MMSFTQEVPEWAHVCDWVKERAEGYIEIQHMGRPYYIPVTKEMKRIFGITRHKNKLAFKGDLGGGPSRLDAEKFLRDMVGGLLNQLSHDVGDEIHSDLNQKLNTFLTETLEPHFEKMIRGRMEQKLLQEAEVPDEPSIS